MSSEPLSLDGLHDAEEHRSSSRRSQREIYLKAKLDYLRMQNKDDHITMELSKVVTELENLYSGESPARIKRQETIKIREGGYAGGQTSAVDRSIPSYSALRDKHCTYVATNNFKNSPFMRQKKAADHAVRYFGGGGGRALTPEENMMKSNLAFLSPLAKPNSPPLAVQRHGSPPRHNKNAQAAPHDPRASVSDALEQMASPAAAALLPPGPVSGPLSPVDAKRGRKNLGPSPTSRKRNKLDHSGPALSPAAERHSPERPPKNGVAELDGRCSSQSTDAEPHLKTPPRLADGRHPSLAVIKDHHAPRHSHISQRHGASGKGTGSAHRERSSSPGQKARSRRSTMEDSRSHAGSISSSADARPWAMDMEDIGEGLALLERLRQEVAGIKHELVVRGFISAAGEEGGGGGLAYVRPPTAQEDSWLQRAVSRESNLPMPPGAPRTFTQCLLFRDRLRVSGYTYATEGSVWLTEVGSLEMRLRNMDRAYDLLPLIVHPIFVNKLAGCTPEHLLSLEEGARKKQLGVIFDALRVLDDGKTVALLVDPFIYEGVHPLGNRHFRVRVLRLPAGNGLAIMAEATQPESVQGRLKVVIYDSELEVLLCHQPGLYRRANAHWSTQQMIAEWLVARLSVHTNDSYEGPDGSRVTTSHLVLDRSIRLPPECSWAVGEDGSKYTLSAWQEETSIALECSKGGTGGGITTATDKVQWVELQAFIGMTMMTKASAELLNREEDPLPRTPLEYLLARVTITPRGALLVDRVMYKEVRNVSGCTVMLHGSVLGADLVYTAQRIKLPGHGGGEGVSGGTSGDTPATGGEVFTRGVTEKDAVRLMLREPAEVRRVLFAYLNRALLCRALTDMLCLVEERGVMRLETALYVPTDMLKLAVRRVEATAAPSVATAPTTTTTATTTEEGGEGGNGNSNSSSQDVVVKPDDQQQEQQQQQEQVVVLGSVLVQSRTTLAQVRRLIQEKLDPDCLPPHFSFETHGAPCSSKQEAEWLARDFLPTLFLVPRHAAALFDEYRAVHDKAIKKAGAGGAAPGKARRPKTTGSDLVDDMGNGDEDEDEEPEDGDKRKKRRAVKKNAGRKGLRKGLSKRKDSLKSIPEVGKPGDDKAGGGEGGGDKKDGREGANEDKAETVATVEDKDAATAGEENGLDSEDPLDEEEKRASSRKAKERAKKKAVLAAELVMVPLLARVTITEGERVVQSHEDLTHVIKPNYLLRLEFPLGPDYKVSAHPDDVYCSSAFTLDRPWVRFVPGLVEAGGAAHDSRPPPIPTKSAAEAEKDKSEAAAKAKVQEGLHILAAATANTRPDPGRRPGPKSLDDLTKEVEKEEAMKQPVLVKPSPKGSSGATAAAPAAEEKVATATVNGGDKPNEEAKEEKVEDKTVKAADQGPEEKKGLVTQTAVANAKGVVQPVADAKAPLPPPHAAPSSSSASKPTSATTKPAPPAGPITQASKGSLSTGPPSSAIANEAAPEGPVEYMNIKVFRVVPKTEDQRPPWRIEYDDEKIPYKLEHRKSHAIHELLHVKLRLARLEAWCKDDFTTYRPLHTQRVNFFGRLPIEPLVQELFRKFTTGRLEGDGIAVTTWQGFIHEADLLPRSIRFLLSNSKLNDLLDPITAVPADRRVAAARMPSPPMTRPLSNEATKRNGRETMMTMATALLDDVVAPRWSDFVDCCGKIDYQGFLCLLQEVAGLHYLRLRIDPESALRTLLLEKLIFKLPDLHALAWAEAKRLAMEHEAKRQAVVMRLQAHLRRKVVVRWYRGIIRRTVKIQAVWRRAIQHWHYKLRIEYLEEDRCIRVRHVAALRIQIAFRCFSAKKKYQKLVDAREKAYREWLATRRARQHEKQRARQQATLYRAARVLAGTCTLIKIFKRDGRKSSKNCDMIVRCYIPASQETIDFDLPEVQVRAFIERFVNRVGLSVQELTDPQNVQCLANRLIVKKIGDRYSVVFSRRSASERGVQVQRRAAHISGTNMVVTVYRTSDEWAFRAYDLKSCEDLRVAITNKTLRKWLQDEERKVTFQALIAKRRHLKEALQVVELAKISANKLVDPEKLREAKEFLQSVGGPEAYESALLEEEKTISHNFDPVMLLPKHQPSLLRWMIQRISMYVRKGDKQRILVLSYEIERILRDNSAAKIQGIYHIIQARKVVRGLLRLKYEKRLDWATKRTLYVNLWTETSSRTRPMLLGPEDLDDPKDEFRAMTDPRGKRYYLNPATGQVTRMSPVQAARIMQTAIRRRLDRDVGRPAMQDVVKAMVMINGAPAKYEEFPDRLTTCLNYALVLHTQTFDWPKARDVYVKAVKRGLENPVVMRCYAIFLLGSCEEPREVNFKRARDLFKQAEIKDPGHERFKTAIECFFKWSLVVQPKHQYGLLNYAILMQSVVADYDKAEAYYRRALTLAPYDPKILRNFEDYLQERLPGGAYGSAGPSSFVVRRSEVIETKELEWGEWQRLRDTKAVKPEFEKYWYDSLTLKTRWERPDFSSHLKSRLQRSKIIRNLGDWKQYKDPVFKKGFVFWCHSLTYQLRIEDPFE